MVIDLKNISKSFCTPYKKETLFENITLSLKRGCTYALTGVSGSGKSTLLHILANLETPSTGTIIWYDNQKIAHAHLSDTMRSNFLSIIFQRPYLINELTVIENCMLKGLIQGIAYQEAFKRAVELLHFVELDHYMQHSITLLSGGQQQRLSIAQSLFFDPLIIIADEPTAHLDQNQAKNIIQSLQKYAKEKQACLIVATHDNNIAQSMDAGYLLKDRTLYPMHF